MHPDYQTSLTQKLTALGAANRWTISKTFRIHEVCRPRGRAVKWLDVILTGATNTDTMHRVRLWKHGPISFMDCPHGALSGQDTMRLFGADTSCPLCHSFVTHLRAHRGIADARYWMDDGGRELWWAMRAASWPAVESPVGQRNQRDYDRSRWAGVHANHASLLERYLTLMGALAEEAVRGTDIHEWRLGVTVGPLAAAAQCHKRGWSKGTKRAFLRLPPEWLKVHRLCGGMMGGKFIGAILSDGPEVREAVAFQLRSPIAESKWARARFVRDGTATDGTPVWRFDRWLRGGAK